MKRSSLILAAVVSLALPASAGARVHHHHAKHHTHHAQRHHRAHRADVDEIPVVVVSDSEARDPEDWLILAEGLEVDEEPELDEG